MDGRMGGDVQLDTLVDVVSLLGQWIDRLRNVGINGQMER